MLPRRGFLSLAGGGAVATALLTFEATESRAPIHPSPTVIENPELPSTVKQWRRLDAWDLPGDPTCVLRTGSGRCLVGGQIEGDAAATGYLAHLGTEAESRVHRFDAESAHVEEIADLTAVDDGVVALGTIGNAAHRLVRVTRDGRVESTTPVHRRDGSLWSPRLFTLSDRDGFRLAGTPTDPSRWADGLATVRLAADGEPRWSRTYGNGVNPYFVRSNGQALATTVSYSGSPSGVLVTDADGLRYHRRIPDHEVFDVRWVGDGEQDLLVVGKADAGNVEQGFVARLDGSGDPRWWRTLSIPEQSTTFTAIARADGPYRIQSIADPAAEDGDYNLEMVVGSDGEVRGFSPYPTAVFDSRFGGGSVFVTESGDEPRLLQYRDENRLDTGGSA